MDLELPIEAILLQMVSSPKIYEGNLINRGNIMILLTGGPGMGKTELMRKVINFYPKSIFSSCTSSTTIGLIALVDKDEQLGEWVVYPGAIPLCHPNGIAVIDELDKIKPDELSKLNSLMDSLQITVHKASVHQTIPCDVSLLVAMNPKGRTFDYESPESLIEQLELPQDVIDRWDLVLNLDAFKSKEHEEKASRSNMGLTEIDETEYDVDIILKYIALARTLDPKVTYASKLYMFESFKEMIGNRLNTKEAYYSKRLQGVLYRLSVAYARLRLGEEIEEMDILDAKNILMESMKSMGLLKLAGNQLVINEEKLMGITPLSQRKLMEGILTYLGEFEHFLLLSEIEDHFPSSTSREIETALFHLYHNKQIFKPREGQYQLQR